MYVSGPTSVNDLVILMERNWERMCDTGTIVVVYSEEKTVTEPALCLSNQNRTVQMDLIPEPD